jgi:hypothetical protein
VPDIPASNTSAAIPLCRPKILGLSVSSDIFDRLRALRIGNKSPHNLISRANAPLLY